MLIAEFRSGFAALLGRPNVGKSSLCNHLVGDKVAIVSDKPQTTRRRILGVVHLPAGQLVLVDTPGVHRPRHQLGRRMLQEARDAVDGVEVACLVVDASAPQPGEGDRRAAQYVAAADVPRILVLNKIDLVDATGPERDARVAAYTALAAGRRPFDGVIATSALSGEGVAELRSALTAYLPPGPPYFPADVSSDQPEQVLAAELVREQALARLREEVPHAVAVTVDQWLPRDNGMIYVGATLYVERESQKGIVIGGGGGMLRDIGAAARQEIERRLGSPVYLDLWVKVKEDWRDRPGSLETLGFGRSR